MRCRFGDGQVVGGNAGLRHNNVCVGWAALYSVFDALLQALCANDIDVGIFGLVAAAFADCKARAAALRYLNSMVMPCLPQALTSGQSTASSAARRKRWSQPSKTRRLFVWKTTISDATTILLCRDSPSHKVEPTATSLCRPPEYSYMIGFIVRNSHHSSDSIGRHHHHILSILHTTYECLDSFTPAYTLPSIRRLLKRNSPGDQLLHINLAVPQEANGQFKITRSISEASFDDCFFFTKFGHRSTIEMESLNDCCSIDLSISLRIWREYTSSSELFDKFQSCRIHVNRDDLCSTELTSHSSTQDAYWTRSKHHNSVPSSHLLVACKQKLPESRGVQVRCRRCRQVRDWSPQSQCCGPSPKLRDPSSKGSWERPLDRLRRGARSEPDTNISDPNDHIARICYTRHFPILKSSIMRIVEKTRKIGHLSSHLVMTEAFHKQLVHSRKTRNPQRNTALSDALDDLDVGLLLVEHLGLVLVAELGFLGTVATNLVPGKLEQLVDTLEGSARSLGDGEPSPDTTDDSDGSEEPEGTGRAETAFAVVEEHKRDSARSGLLALRKLEVFVFNVRNSGKEGSDVSHRDGLAGNTDAERTLATDPVDQEESAGNGSDELDNTENGSGEQLLVLTLGAKESEKVGSQIFGDDNIIPLQKLTDLASEANVNTLAHSSFLLLVKLVLDFSNFALHNLVINWESTDTSQNERMKMRPAKIKWIEVGTSHDEVSKHDTDVDGARKDACAQGNDCSLADTQTGNEATSVDLAKTTSANGAGHEDHDTENPHETELASGPETTNTCLVAKLPVQDLWGLISILLECEDVDWLASSTHIGELRGSGPALLYTIQPLYPRVSPCHSILRRMANGLTVPGGLHSPNRLIWRKPIPQTPAWGVVVAFGGVPVCFGRIVLTFGGERLQIWSVRRPARSPCASIDIVSR
ncbi:hypothetical protein KCU81_g240, partial [Aureobasidium melanogenum]